MGLLREPAAPLDDLIPLVYDELRRMAHHRLVRERGAALDTTALVHEAYLRLVDDTQVTQRGRAYFFGAAARAMRTVLIDLARRHNALKRGGGRRDQTWDDNARAPDLSELDGYAARLLDLDAALDDLARLNERHARVVECRFFGGLTAEETADVLGLSPRAVQYDWAAARAWLQRTLGETTS
jgi:RNA polymerase sigma factor (TIGR02999 family)